MTGIGLLGWASCSVYDESLLEQATGGSGISLGGSIGNAGEGTGETAGMGGTGATGASAGAGSGGDANGGKAAANGGGTAGKESGGTSGREGGAAGRATSGGGGGSSGTGIIGTAGEGGEGGEAACSQGDCCPDDDSKVAPGACGCGEPDTDTDSDDTPDCLDGCVDDPVKTSPGTCGCGVAETVCMPLVDSLVHRYSFEGTGTTVTDTKGTAHGTVMGVGAALDGDGTLELAGGYVPSVDDPKKQYVALPAGCLDGLTDATFDVWFDWAPADGTNAQSFWQRIFDLGETASSGVGTYVFASPRVSSATGPSRISLTNSKGSANQVLSNGPTLAAGPHHFTVVVDDTNDQFNLYVDGVFASAVALSGSLSAINDTNCYLGRSQFVDDPYFAGALDEFRVHAIAFTATEVAFSHASGPNPAFLDR